MRRIMLAAVVLVMALGSVGGCSSSGSSEPGVKKTRKFFDPEAGGRQPYRPAETAPK